MSKVAVVALGKIGLPLAVQFAEKRGDVVGVDIDERVVDLVNRGVEPFPGEAHLAEKLDAVVSDGRLRATTDFADAIDGAEVIVVVVPVVVDGDGRPAFGAIDAATRSIGASLTQGALVSYETTLPVHTTRQRFVPALEEASGLRCGNDFYVCHSPERVLTGRTFADLRKYPKLVGGVDEGATERAIGFYRSVLDFDERPDLDRANGVWDLGTAEAAELAKLAETTYRNINIAFANELAIHATSLGVDADLVIDASNSQPYSHIHRPGIAVGGHCIPVYPKLYMASHTDATVPLAAVRVNESMPGRAVQRLEERLGALDGRRVAILGIVYRGGVKETAFSGAFPVRDELVARGATVVAHDPLYDDDQLRAEGFEPYHLGEPVDGVIVQADHAEYADLGPSDLPGASAVFDGRRILDPGAFGGIPVDAFGAPATVGATDR